MSRSMAACVIVPRPSTRLSSTCALGVSGALSTRTTPLRLMLALCVRFATYMQVGQMTCVFRNSNCPQRANVRQTRVLGSARRASCGRAFCHMRRHCGALVKPGTVRCCTAVCEVLARVQREGLSCPPTHPQHTHTHRRTQCAACCVAALCVKACTCAAELPSRSAP